MSSVPLRFALKAMAGLVRTKRIEKLEDLPPAIRQYALLKDHRWKFQQLLDEIKLADMNDVVERTHTSVIGDTFTVGKDAEEEAVAAEALHHVNTNEPIEDPRKVLKAAKSRKQLRKLIKEIQESSGFSEKPFEFFQNLKESEDGTVSLSDENEARLAKMEEEMKSETLGTVTKEMLFQQLESMKGPVDIKTTKINELRLQRMMKKFIQDSTLAQQNEIHINLKDKGIKRDTAEFYTHYLSPNLVKKINKTNLKGSEMIALLKQEMRDEAKIMAKGQDLEYILEEIEKQEFDEVLMEKAYKMYLAYNPYHFLKLLDGEAQVSGLKISDQMDENQTRFVEASRKYNEIQNKSYQNFLKLNFLSLMKILEKSNEIDWTGLKISDKMTCEQVIKHLGKDKYKMLITKLFAQSRMQNFSEIDDNLATILKGIDNPLPCLKNFMDALDSGDLNLVRKARSEIDLSMLKKETKGHPRQSELLYMFENNGKLDSVLSKLPNFNISHDVTSAKWLKEAKHLLQTQGIDSIFKYDFMTKTASNYYEQNGTLDVDSRKKYYKSKVPEYYVETYDELTTYHDQETEKPRPFRKVILTAEAKNFGLSIKGMLRFRNICQGRYCPQNDILTLKSELYPTRELNEQYCVQLMMELIRESKKADEGAEIGPDVKLTIVPQLDQIKTRLKRVHLEDVQSSQALGVWTSLVELGKEVVDAQSTYGLHVKKEVEEVVESLDQ